METAERRQKVFVGYEYKEVIADSDKVSFLMDGYKNFGWELDENIFGNNMGVPPEKTYSPNQPKVVIRLKRNRKIMNRMELTRLQRNFEACVNEIGKLERSKTSAATIYAILIGLAGTAFMAGSVFAVTAKPQQIGLSVILTILAFAGWILPYFVFKYITEKRTEKVMSLIEGKYDEIYEICEKGNKLLN